MREPDGLIKAAAVAFEDFTAGLLAELAIETAETAVSPAEGLIEFGIDSLALAEVVAYLAEFGIELPTDLIGELRTFGDVYHYYSVGFDRA
jgi:acyl carrier protein